MNNESQFDRYLSAQESSYDTALAEIRRGAKVSHWMWFVFPQLAGLGHSTMALYYALSSLEGARSYLAHPILGQRYRECVTALQDLDSHSAATVFGALDAMKLKSSLTLFARAGEEPLIAAALDRWFGEEDRATLRLLDLA